MSAQHNASFCFITAISTDAFNGQNTINTLDLTNNPLTNIDSKSVVAFKHISLLILKHTTIPGGKEYITDVSYPDIFRIETDKNSQMCCLFLHTNAHCTPAVELSKCRSDFLSYNSLRPLAYIQTCLIALLNFTVLLFHIRYTYSMLRLHLINLSIANMLIAPFEALLLISDSHLSNIFSMNIEDWTKTHFCILQAFISTLAMIMNSLVCFLIALQTYKGTLQVQHNQKGKTSILVGFTYFSLWLLSIGISSTMVQQLPNLKLKSVSCIPLLLTVQNLKCFVIVLKVILEGICYLSSIVIYAGLILRLRHLSKEIRQRVSVKHVHKTRTC